MCILIVEYSFFLRQQLRKMFLQVDGVDEVLESRNMLETKRLICLHDVDVVVLDTQISGGRAVDLLKFIRDVKEPSVTVICLMRSYSPLVKQRWIRLGSHYVLDKYRELKHASRIVQEQKDIREEFEHAHSIADKRFYS